MSKKQLERWKLVQQIHQNDRSGNKEGFCKFYPNNKEEHEDAKWQIFKKLKRQGFEVWTECRLLDAGRGDIVAIKNGHGYIVEVLCSETDEMFEDKKIKYPSEFTLVKFDTKKQKPEDFDL